MKTILTYHDIHNAELMYCFGIIHMINNSVSEAEKYYLMTINGSF